jgi:predicted NUDIX family NTP pyrophosphohydrolase
MARESAGLLLFRRRGQAVEVLLVHPGGPFWRRKDAHAWSIPKGEVDASEEQAAAARREFAEETGFRPEGALIALGSRRQAGGKLVHVWAMEGDWDPAALRSTSFSMEWPPRSGRMRDFPEVDRAEWFELSVAAGKLHKGQVGFLELLRAKLDA